MSMPDSNPHQPSPRHKQTLRSRVRLSLRHAIYLSIVVLLAGIGISVDLSDWSWFSRSGSLVVIIGIFMTSSQIIENTRRMKLHRMHRGQNFNRDYAEDIKKDSLKRSRGLDEDNWENGLRGLYMLVTGTLVWGFGDLVGVLF